MPGLAADAALYGPFHNGEAIAPEPPGQFWLMTIEAAPIRDIAFEPLHFAGSEPFSAPQPPPSLLPAP